jgi:hypothetical protein
MPADPEYGSVLVGRVVLREATELATESWSGSDRVLAITGQESNPPQTPVELAQLQDDLLSLPGRFVPVIFTNKADRNGYYWVQDAAADLTNWGDNDVITCRWKVTLARAGSDSDLDVESRMSGSATRNNSFGATGTRWHSPPIGHYSYYAGGGVVPSIVTRTGSDGAQAVYLGLTPTVNPRWGCAVADYPKGRVRFLDSDSTERSGITLSLGPTGWALHNGLCRVTLAGAAGVSGSNGTIGASGVGVLNVAAWDGGAWAGKDWDLLRDAASLGAPLGCTLLRNDYEAVLVRLMWQNNPGPGRTDLDILLRRGARFAELWMQSSTSATCRIARATVEVGTSTSGYVTATSNDADGNKYFLAGAGSFTADTGNGGASRSSSTGGDFAVGAVLGGSSAVTGDVAADLYKQYLGAPSERVQGVRR